MIGREADEIINEILDTLENKIKGSSFVVHYIDGISCLSHKIILHRSGLFKDFLGWIRKKVTVNPIKI